ncbi:MAG TPA: hypothetical protein VLA19_25515 [Herpetosiphonaceae bacterium]|nr:hypothetical protein [Herpetosiphonaceae bacterium]
MLSNADRDKGIYHIAFNNASDGAELMADLSYLGGAPSGTLTFDFRQMAAPLTQEQREEWLPGGFGYQPTQLLLEVLGAMMAYLDCEAAQSHRIKAILPTPMSRVGRFLVDMQLPQILHQMGIQLRYDDTWVREYGHDDPSRQNLIPLTLITVSTRGPDFRILRTIRKRVERVFSCGLPGDSATPLPPDLAEQFATVVNEAVDNMIEYGAGGLIAGLYYRKAGEVEITLVNRCGGFGGTNATEQLETLIDACDGMSSRSNGGGNGIITLSRLAGACFGTLLLRNGSATVRLSPDGSVDGSLDETGIQIPGAAVTLLLQLLPEPDGKENETRKAFEAVLRNALNAYMQQGNER